MSFIRETVEHSMDIWEKCFSHKFIDEMSKGTLDEEKFKRYIIQDSIYIKEYAKVYAVAMSKSNSFSELRFYYSLLGFVTENEGATRIKYLKQFGLDDDAIESQPILAENKNYYNYMHEVAKDGDLPEILMAVLPCMLSYGYIGDRIIKEYKDVKTSKYWELINDYSSTFYLDCCRVWGEYTENVCKDLPAERKQKLMEIFRTSSMHELNFWDMSYGK